MNLDIAKRWIEALRSGEYKQAQGQLSHAGRYCCLGVLCDIYSKEHKEPWTASGNSLTRSRKLLGKQSSLPIEVQRWVGMQSQIGMYEGGI